VRCFITLASRVKSVVNLLKDFDIDLSENDKIDLILDATKAKAKTLKELAQEIKKILESPKEYDKKALKKAFKGEAKELLTQFLELLFLKNLNC